MTLEVTLTLVGSWLPVTGGVVFLFLLVYVVGACLCVGGKEKETSLSTGKYTSSGRKASDVGEKVDSTSVEVDTGVVAMENGQAGSGSLRVSNTSQRSPSHSPNYANQRQLPAPPQGNGSVRRSLHDEDDDVDDYDHLETNTKSMKRGSNYDHVVIGEDGSVKIKERKVVETDYAEVSLENIYTPVKESAASVKTKNYSSKARVNVTMGSNDDEYAMVSSASEKEPMLSAQSKDKEDPYAKLREKEDPYAKLKEKDDPYNKVKEADDPYNKVKETDDPYNKVKETDDPYNMVKETDDPYNKVKETDDPYNKVKETDDPYNKVKDVDDPYNKVREEGDSAGSFEDVDPYNTVKDTEVKDVDPYNRVKDVDPYNRVEDDDPYNRIKGDDPPYNKIKGDDDPYNKIKVDDPYNKVDDDDFIDIMDDPKDQYSTVDPNRKTKQVTTITVTHNVGGGASSGGGGAPVTEGTFRVEESTNDYAVVVKNRSDSSTVAAVGSMVTGSNVTDISLPPEPPRNYREEEPTAQAPPPAAVVPPTDTVSESQVQSQGATGVNQTQAGEQATEQEAGSPRREPGYIKLTSRESMASINARRSLNTYETVAETENMYATVEGGSGDGVVQAPPTNSASNRVSLPNDFYAEIGGSRDRTVQNASTNPNPNRTSLPNDFYAEIGGEHPARVPAPPSLDSLHLMTKTHHDGRQGSRSSTEESELWHSQTEQLSPGSFVNSPPHGASGGITYSEAQPSNPALRSAGSAIGPVTLDPDYQTVRDCVNDLDVDPNYESVEEARAKVFVLEQKNNGQMSVSSADGKKRRNHVYEEVKPSPSSSDTRSKQTHASRSHMYEDIDVVREQKRELNRKSQEISKSKKL